MACRRLLLGKTNFLINVDVTYTEHNKKNVLEKLGIPIVYIIDITLFINKN